MAPYFETVKSFADVPVIAEGIDTKAFLDASDGLIQMFELFGPGVFSFIQSDLRSNIAGVRSRYEATHVSSGTLEELLRNEGKEASKHATPCLVRLTRICRQTPLSSFTSVSNDHMTRFSDITTLSSSDL
ncbi:hypothetical protein H2248_011166 [Termitomyces sp. 'cryptogamus']|nr:hypothetical protein H2248_011166 [Termitomyces sp. 'cryptogamus']